MCQGLCRAQGCAACQGLCHAPGSPPACRLLPVPVGPVVPGRWWWAGWAAASASSALLGLGWARLLFLEEGGQRLSPPPAAVPGKGRDLPAPSVSQGEAEARYNPAVAHAWHHRAAVPGHVARGGHRDRKPGRDLPHTAWACRCLFRARLQQQYREPLGGTHAGWILLPPVLALWAPP